MVRKMWKVAIILMGLLLSRSAFGQVYGFYDSKGVLYYTFEQWMVGAPPFQFGLQEYTYYTDATGAIVIIDAWRPSKPGDVFHWGTVVHLGSISFSLPFHRGTVAIFFFVIMAGILVLGDWVLKKFRRGAVPAEK